MIWEKHYCIFRCHFVSLRFLSASFTLSYIIPQSLTYLHSSSYTNQQIFNDSSAIVHSEKSHRRAEPRTPIGRPPSHFALAVLRIPSRLPHQSLSRSQSALITMAITLTCQSLLPSPRSSTLPSDLIPSRRAAPRVKLC